MHEYAYHCICIQSMYMDRRSDNMESEYKLTYFTFKGKAEVIRLLFAAAGVNYDDVRLQYMGKDWESFKAVTPIGNIPVLTVGDNDMVCQSTTIARYLAKKFGYFGSTPQEEFLIDEVLECVKDMVVAYCRILYEHDTTRKAELQKLFDNVHIPMFVKYVKRRFRDGTNGYLIGAKMSVADIAVFDFVDQQIEAGSTCFTAHVGIMSHNELVKSNPNIGKWLSVRPDDVY